MIKRILTFIISSMCITMFAGVGVASADVLSSNQQVISNSVVTVGITVVYNPPFGGP